MVRVLKPFSAVIATVLSLGLATADTATVSVLGDATYTIPSSRGEVCKGTGAYPSGTACPLKGDEASDGCSEGVPSYTYGKCVAPKDAQCVLVSDDTWGCAYPEKDTEAPCASTEQSSYGETETPYESAPSASGYGEVTYPAEETYPKEDEVTFPYESTPCPSLPYSDDTEEGYPVEDTPYPTQPHSYGTGEGAYPAETTPYPTHGNSGEEAYPTKDTPCPSLPYTYDTEEAGYPTEATPYPTNAP
ncbi:hypothetical protein F442_12387, partial [Phytophthora nicotianae P10297]